VYKRQIAYWVTSNFISLFSGISVGSLYESKFGMSVGDSQKFIRNWFEVSILKIGINKSKDEFISENNKWCPLDKGGEKYKWYGNQESIVNWENDGIEIKALKNSAVRSPQYFFKQHISWNLINSKGTAFRYFPKGFILDTASNCTYVEDELDTLYLLGLYNSVIGSNILNVLNPTINLSCGVVNLLPFLKGNLNFDIVKENISITKKNWNSHETSWDFHKSYLINDTKLLKIGYNKWQDSVTQDFFKLHANEEELNRIFLEIYGLQDELASEVALQDITILQDELKKNDLDLLEEKFRAQGKDAICLLYTSDAADDMPYV
jgi:hypothetical protein